MAANRTAGPISNPPRVEDGTMVRVASPGTGVTGQHVSADSVVGWPLKEKLTVALQRTAPLLPASMREQFLALLSPANLAITVGVLAVWVGSHAFGVGEVVDAVLAVVGGVMMGMSIVGVVRDIRKFAVLAGSAKTQRDLDLAAAHLADAIAVIGVNVFAVVVTEGAAKIGARPLELPPKTPPVVEAHPVVPEPPRRLYQMMTPEMDGDGPIAQALRRAALDDFYQSFAKLDYKGMMYDDRTGEWVRSRPEQRRASHIAGTDLTRPVFHRTLQPGEVIAMYQRVGGQPGTYLARVGTPAAKLGISPVGRIVKLYRVVTPLEAIESTAADMANAAPGVGGKGGAQQLIMLPDWERHTRPF